MNSRSWTAERIAAYATILGLPIALLGVHFANLQVRSSPTMADTLRPPANNPTAQSPPVAPPTTANSTSVVAVSSPPHDAVAERQNETKENSLEDYLSELDKKIDLKINLILQKKLEHWFKNHPDHSRVLRRAVAERDLAKIQWRGSADDNQHHFIRFSLFGEYVVLKDWRTGIVYYFDEEKLNSLSQAPGRSRLIRRCSGSRPQERFWECGRLGHVAGAAELGR